MKAGIITFHWAANYGAVLQTYALQKAIEKIGVDVEIIDYMPKQHERTLLDCFVSRSFQIMKIKLREYKKSKKINADMTGKLQLSAHYSSAEELRKNPPLYDVYISGSDQIWNEYFTLEGEGKVTLSYFLDFAPEQAKRISYATSIGSNNLCEEYWNVTDPLLRKYASIGVRERSARQLLNERGFHALLLPDPTLLVGKEEYNTIFATMPSKVVYYGLQNNQKTIETLRDYLKGKCEKDQFVDLNKVSLRQWGGYIAAAECVLTNSYHGIIFSILNHRNFFAALIEGELNEMNDRVLTLLERLQLKSRIVSSVEELKAVGEENIDWDTVDRLLGEYKAEGLEYLKNNLK